VDIGGLLAGVQAEVVPFVVAGVGYFWVCLGLIWVGGVVAVFGDGAFAFEHPLFSWGEFGSRWLVLC